MTKYDVEWIAGATQVVVYAGPAPFVTAPADVCGESLRGGRGCGQPAVATLTPPVLVPSLPVVRRVVCKRHYRELLGIATTGEGAHHGRGSCWACGEMIGNYHADGCVVYAGGAHLVVGPSR